MRGFLGMECDGRTNERTDKRESIGLSAEAERPINVPPPSITGFSLGFFGWGDKSAIFGDFRSLKSRNSHLGA